MSASSADRPQIEPEQRNETSSESSSARVDLRRPYLVAAIVALLLFGGLVPLAASFVAWGEAGCGTRCESWGALVYFFIGFTAVTAAVTVLVARGLWMRRRWAWVVAVLFQLVMFVPADPHFRLLGVGTVNSTNLVGAAYPLTLIVLLSYPHVFRWYWKREPAAASRG